MDIDESLTTRLWLENYGNITKVVSPSELHYQVKKINLSKSQIEEIEKFLKTNNISWEVLINAAWGLFLNHFSSSCDIAYGTSNAICTRKNTLQTIDSITPIKSIIGEKISIKTFLQKIKIQLQKKIPASPNFANELRYLLFFKCNKTKKRLVFVTDDAERFPLILLVDKKKLNSLSLYFNPDLFSHFAIESIFEHLLLFLHEICIDQKQKTVYINLLTAEEKKLLLEEWNKPIYKEGIPNLKKPIHELFAEKVQKFPENVAVSFSDVSVTYLELDKLANELAQYLIERGVKPGDPICVLMDRTPTLLMAMLAIFKCGGVFVPINPKYPDERIEYILKDSAAKFIVVNNVERLAEDTEDKTIVIDPAWENVFIPETAPTFLPDVTPDSLAYIIYTSGTTGKPKGVMVRHRSLTNLIAWYQGYFKVTEKDKASQFASQGFDTFLCETIPFLASGASVHIVDDNIKLTPVLFFNWLEQNKITLLDLPTSYAFMLFSLTWPNNLKIRLLKIGGESVTHYPEQTFPFDIWNGYGPTEATIEATFYKIYSANSPVKHLQTAPPIGKAIANTEVYVVDKNLKPVPIGVSGELLLGGISIAAGYLNREDLTQQKFIPHIVDKNSPYKLYRTGDLVHYMPDGNLAFVGRIDHQVKIRGYRIELGDIETAISQHPDVNEVVVMTKENLSGDKSLIAYIVPNLERERYLYQERCLLSVSNNKYIEAVTEDISKNGVALSGVSEKINIGHLVQLHLKLPGFIEAKLLSGHLIWQQNNRCGIAFDLNEEEKLIVQKSIDYYVSTHNVMELVLSASAKRSLRKALKKKLPDYMVPTVFVTLLQFPLTFSGKIDVKALPPPQDFEQILQTTYIPAKTETEKQLANIWCNILGRKDVSMSDNFFDIGGNSLTAAELSVQILAQFKQSIPTKLLFDLTYIPILAEYIDTKGKSYSNRTVIQDEINRDSQLHENILPSKKLSENVNHPENILLTGAGGFLGIYLLRELLQTTQAKIYCLIRKGEFESAAKRLISTIQRFELEKDLSLNDRRIVVIASDISFDHFGLPLEQYNNLVDKIDLIYHCGAQVNIMAAYNKLRGSNVIGTLEVIKFATKHVDKPIHYVSTLSAAYKKDDAGNLVEEFPDDHYDELFGGYAISKWVSERLLLEIKNRGLPAVVYRSGYISGQSDTGMTNLNDALLMLIKGCIQLGVAPYLEEKITILPVDFVSKCIIQISLAHPTRSGVYHVDHPTGILWSDLVAWLNDYGYKIKIIPLKQWQQMLLNIPKDNALFPFLPYYLAMQEQYQPPGVNVDRTTLTLKELNIAYPKIDNELLTIYFDYLCQINFIPMPYKRTEVQKV